MKQFTYKEEDRIGQQTLETIAAADRFNTWMAETIEPYLHPGRVLEIGSGIGNISARLMGKGYRLTLTDLRKQYIDQLAQQFDGHPDVEAVMAVDLVHPDFEVEYSALLGRYDSLFALNVVEHIEDDGQALANAQKLLRAGGSMVILVPAYQALYNGFDENLEHYRRYTRKTLTGAFEKSGIRVKKSFHFNAMGILGWWVSGSLLKKPTIPEGQMGLYNRLVPAFRLLDALLFRQVGLSVIAVGEKPAGSQ